ncbi:histidinol-phosphate transaminase [Ornithinibacillus massiliensis]|uniref:Histidinol-phosphate aminotransferase n=1 Tax=Ornithinibacillus massiliensis TaxID=1944633 RepID=A0ABS5MGM5_9BACI|nr:histidinol-phosphate transaminase [Ornithinibacillus massiliensis]MBS3681473.1 histidinol-phosphate transaminase [Ornithinibacillus massiliensis]
MSKYWSSIVNRTDPYVPGEQINDSSLIKLNTNENPYPPPESVIKAIQDEIGESLKLYPSPTVDELREAIAKAYDVRKENIFVGNGSDEVLAFSFMAFFEPGVTIRFPAITYSFYTVYAKLFNIPYEEVRLNQDFTLNTHSLFHSEGGVIFPNPNAPTGILLPIEQVEEVLLHNQEKVVIIDEAYSDFAKESAVPLIQKYPNLLVIQTTSKSRSLAGLRVGYAIGSPELIEGLNKIKNSFNSYTIDRLAMAGAIAAMNADSYYKKTTAKVIETREWLSKELSQLGFHVLPSQANFIFISHPNKKAKSLYAQLKENGILVRHFSKAAIENFIRITIGTKQDMITLLERLKIILKEKSTW